MSFYTNSIIEVTNCNKEDANAIEDYMRNVIFHSTLDWQTEAQFNKGAKTAYKDILFMRSDEGKLYMERLEAQILN